MSVTTIPSHTYPPGTTAFGPIIMPGGTSRMALSLLRESWPDSAGVEIISITWEASLDGGVTWPINGSFGAAGGVLPLDKNGQPQLSSKVTWLLPTPCRIRGTVILSQTLTTTITLTLT